MSPELVEALRRYAERQAAVDALVASIPIPRRHQSAWAEVAAKIYWLDVEAQYPGGWPPYPPRRLKLMIAKTRRILRFLERQMPREAPQ